MARGSKKSALKSPLAHFVLPLLISIVLRTLYFTCRVEKHFTEEALPYIRGEKPMISCFWHGRMIMQPFIKPPRRKTYVLKSRHSDGIIINNAMRWFGIDSIIRQKKMGSTATIRGLLEITAKGGNLAITPDGPRGPIYKAAPGATYVSAKTAHPLLPVTFSATRCWRIKSWDRFMIPKPFSKIVFVAGAMQFDIPDEDEAIERANQKLENELNAITHRADEICGVVT